MAQEINKQWAYLLSRGKTDTLAVNKQWAYVLKGPSRSAPEPEPGELFFSSIIVLTGDIDALIDLPPVPETPVPVSFRYWRLKLNTSLDNNWMNIAEVEFRKTAGDPASKVSGSAFASTSFSGSGPARAFDGSTGTSWNSGNNGVPHYLGLDLGDGAAQAVVEVQMTMQSGTAAWPINFEVEGSNDNIAWTLVKAFPTVPNWTSGETRVFSLVG